MSENEIVPIAIPGIHERFFGLFKRITKVYTNPKVLEMGAGHGAFTKKLHDNGYDVYANDLFPDYYRFKEVECIQVDITDKQPYEFCGRDTDLRALRRKIALRTAHIRAATQEVRRDANGNFGRRKGDRADSKLGL